MQRFDLGLRAHGCGKMWAGIAEFEGQAHSLCGNENVGENDHRIDAKAAEGLERDFGGEIRVLADFEKRMFGTNGAVFGEVAAGLAHHPDGNTWKRFAAAGTEKEFFTAERFGKSHHVAHRAYRRSGLNGAEGLTPKG